MNPIKLSKFLGLILRHETQKFGISLDAQGWVSCDALIKSAATHGMAFNHDDLAAVVRDSDKQRFGFNEDQTSIRANQGHSVSVDLQLSPTVPPIVLFHGTVAKFINSIKSEGLKKGERHHVHLSPDISTASRVGARRGEAVILKIRAAEMAACGFDFYCSDNGVWLTDFVPVEFLEFDLDSTTLYRPVGPTELKLIEGSDWKAFPPRLPDQPIFYPVMNEAYAVQIARDWNVKASGSGFVTRFKVKSDYLEKFPIRTVGGRQHTELWIPAEELKEFNRHIIGKIEVTQKFPQEI